MLRVPSQRLRALAFAASLAVAIPAQSFFEGFEPGPTPVGYGPVPAMWTCINNSPSGVGTNPHWAVTNNPAELAPLAGAAYAFANSNSVFGANNISNYLISPLRTFQNGDTISFFTRTVDAPLYPDRLALVMNTTGSTLPAHFTTTLLTINPNLLTTGYPSVWTQYTATISGLSGPTPGRFAFHYNPFNGGPLGLNSDFVAVDNVTYFSVGSGAIATNTVLGTGCGGTFNSFYRYYPDAVVASAALQGNALRLVATPNGYTSTWLPGAAASLFVTPVAPTVLATTDDGSVPVTPSVPLPTPYGPQATLHVTGNGVIGFGATAPDSPGTVAWIPTVGGFLNSGSGGIYSWHDYNEVEGGDVLRHESGGVLYITFQNVESYPPMPTVNPSTLQFQLNLTNGNVVIVWSHIDTNTGSVDGSMHLVGVTAPGASADPGSVNLASGSYTTVQPETPALSLTATNTPIQSAATRSWNLVANNLPNGIGFVIIGLSDPGITDLAPLGFGRTGCQLRASLDITGAVLLSGSSLAWSFGIPGGIPALSGLDLFAQTAVLSLTGNLAHTLTTNGIQGRIGVF